MIIEIPAYKHILNNQQINLSSNKIQTFIGGNGAGKSTLLESIFYNYIEKENELREEENLSINNTLRCIVFSSGQNELFSEIFNNYEKNAKRYNREDDQLIRSFYFDYWWSQLLIFFSTALKQNGLVRNYLKEHNYIDENEENIDISSNIKFGFRIRKPIIDKIKNELEIERRGEFLENPLYRSIYIKYLEKLSNHLLNKEFDFTDSDSIDRIVSTTVTLKAENVIDALGTNINELFTFISRASTSWLSNFDLEGIECYFKELNLSQLSDGEYQLLSIYAIIDLFDNQNTLFLLDEVDSHLHYTNLNKLWTSLKNISGRCITTTHISESILNNSFETMSYIDNGKIQNSLSAREIFRRISNIVGEKDYLFKIGAKINNIVLVDDEVDWIIFKKLALKKIGDKVIPILDKVVPYKRSSSFNTATEIFGKGKLEFVREFKEKNSNRNINTKNIFLLCDRDSLPLTQINLNTLQVNIENSYSDIKNFGNTKTYLQSWRMLEIENYLLSKTMLQYYNKYEEFKSNLPSVNFNGITTFDESEDIRTYDAKEILHPLYKTGGFNEVKLDELIAKIPQNEISDDIKKIYEFIKGKVLIS